MNAVAGHVDLAETTDKLDTDGSTAILAMFNFGLLVG